MHFYILIDGCLFSFVICKLEFIYLFKVYLFIPGFSEGGIYYFCTLCISVVFE